MLCYEYNYFPIAVVPQVARIPNLFCQSHDSSIKDEFLYSSYVLSARSFTDEVFRQSKKRFLCSSHDSSVRSFTHEMFRQSKKSCFAHHMTRQCVFLSMKCFVSRRRGFCASCNNHMTRHVCSFPMKCFVSRRRVFVLIT